MYELSLVYPEISGLAAEWSWDVTHYDTVDHLPFAGVHSIFRGTCLRWREASMAPLSAWLALAFSSGR